MYTVFKEFSFSAAHFIRGHTRGCQNLHGHNYRVRVHLSARQLDALGMVLDFQDLKAVMKEILDPFDHHVLNELEPFDRVNTTAELISGHIYDEVARRIGTMESAAGRVQVRRVEVWETDTSCAIYEP